MPIISVIVPVYKVEPYLHRCVDSILAQSFQDFELILVDDGSPDRCGEICDEYAAQDGRIRVIHKENGGLSSARNAGIDWVFANSDSTWLNFVDSDDWVHPQYLELLYRASSEFRTEISQCLFFETDGSMKLPEIQGKTLLVTSEEQYIKWYSAYFCGKLFAASCLKTIRFPEGQLYEDVAIWYKVLFSQANIGIVSDALYYYYQNPDSILRSHWKPAKLAQVDAWKQQLRFLQDYGNERVFNNAVWRYFYILRQQLESEAASTAITKHEKRKYRHFLLNTVRGAIIRYRKTPTVKKHRRQYLKLCFPKTTAFLLHCRNAVRGGKHLSTK